jgi:hypothetical protein
VKQHTNIQLQPETRERLKEIGRKGETYDEILSRLLNERISVLDAKYTIVKQYWDVAVHIFDDIMSWEELKHQDVVLQKLEGAKGLVDDSFSTDEFLLREEMDHIAGIHHLIVIPREKLGEKAKERLVRDQSIERRKPE